MKSKQPSQNLAGSSWERAQDSVSVLLSLCHTPAADPSREAAPRLALPLRGLFAATALEQPSSRCLKNAE